MKTNNVYVIYDKVAEEAGPLFEAVNDGVAVRQMCQSMRNVENPDDYSLFHVGEITRETGQVCLLPCGNREISYVLSPDKKIAVLKGGSDE